MNVATLVFGSFSSSSVGRRSFHTSLTLILRVLSSYWTRPLANRNLDNLVSFSAESPSCSESSAMLCHAPSLITAKNLSTLKLDAQ